MSSLLTSIISLLVGGLVDIGQGIGGALSELVQAIFVTVGTDGAMELTTFGGLVVIFAAISLGLGLCRLVLNWITGLGGGNL